MVKKGVTDGQTDGRKKRTIHRAAWSQLKMLEDWARYVALRWPHYERDGVSNHQSHDCLLNHLFRRRSKETPKLRVTGLCAGISTVTGEFPAQRASNADNVSIWWCRDGLSISLIVTPLAPGQSYDWPCASKAVLKNMGVCGNIW